MESRKSHRTSDLKSRTFKSVTESFVPSWKLFLRVSLVFFAAPPLSSGPGVESSFMSLPFHICLRASLLRAVPPFTRVLEWFSTPYFAISKLNTVLTLVGMFQSSPLRAGDGSAVKSVCILLLQRTQVQVPAPSWWLTTACYFSYRGCGALF